MGFGGERTLGIDLHAGDHFLLEYSTHFEFDDAFGGHSEPLKGFGVLSGMGGTGVAFEDAEIPEFEPIAFGEFADDFIQEGLNDPFDHDVFGLRDLGNPIDELLLGNGCHRLPQ
jgi:hypothetical protein